jgi:hypothetical protein
VQKAWYKDLRVWALVAAVVSAGLALATSVLLPDFNPDTIQSDLKSQSESNRGVTILNAVAAVLFWLAWFLDRRKFK